MDVAMVDPASEPSHADGDGDAQPKRTEVTVDDVGYCLWSTCLCLSGLCSLVLVGAPGLYAVIQFGVPPDRSLFEWAEAHFEKWSGGSYKDWHATNWRTAKAQRRRTGDLLENPPLCVVKVVFVLTSSGLEPADVGEVMPVRFKPIIEPHPRAKKGGGQRDDALLLLVMSLAIDYSNATGRKPGRTGTEDHHFETLVRRVWERLGLANADGEPGSTYYVRRYLKTMNHPIPIV